MKTMNPEERFERIEHQLEFLAVSIQSHDAQIAENARHLAESRMLIDENSKQIAAHSEQIAAQSGQIAHLSDLILRVGRIAEEQAKRMDASQALVDDPFKTLVKLHARADERVNILINTIERRFPE